MLGTATVIMKAEVIIAKAFSCCYCEILLLAAEFTRSKVAMGSPMEYWTVCWWIWPWYQGGGNMAEDGVNVAMKCPQGFGRSKALQKWLLKDIVLTSGRGAICWQDGGAMVVKRLQGSAGRMHLKNDYINNCYFSSSSSSRNLTSV